MRQRQEGDHSNRRPILYSLLLSSITAHFCAASLSVWIDHVKLLLVVTRPKPGHVVMGEHDTPIVNRRIHNVAAHAWTLVGNPAEDSAVLDHTT